MKEASTLYRLLGDEARLRLLRVLATDRFNVTELTGILGLAQSGVSRHLGLLKDAGLVSEERNGAFTYYRLSPSLQHGNGEPLWPLLKAQFEHAAGSAGLKADDARLQEVLRLRKENFLEHADAKDNRQLVPGRSWAAWSRALGLLLPPLRVADLGCGEGYLTIEASRWAASVVGIDRSEAVLARARALGQRRRAGNGATDPLARSIAKGALARGWDDALSPPQRQFLAMPLMHSEAIADQLWALALYRRLGPRFGWPFARSHHRMIARFGRFPHRNAVLGRRSTPAEVAAVEAGNSW